MPSKLYDQIKQLLIAYPKLRDSDRLLTWEIWKLQGKVKDGSISLENFMTADLTETIRRTRQKVQQLNKTLCSSVAVQKYKDAKRATKSVFVYHDKTPIFNENGTVSFNGRFF